MGREGGLPFGDEFPKAHLQPEDQWFRLLFSISVHDNNHQRKTETIDDNTHQRCRCVDIRIYKLKDSIVGLTVLVFTLNVSVRN